MSIGLNGASYLLLFNSEHVVMVLLFRSLHIRVKLWNVPNVWNRRQKIVEIVRDELVCIILIDAFQPGTIVTAIGVYVINFMHSVVCSNPPISLLNRFNKINMVKTSKNLYSFCFSRRRNAIDYKLGYWILICTFYLYLMIPNLFRNLSAHGMIIPFLANKTQSVRNKNNMFLRQIKYMSGNLLGHDESSYYPYPSIII